MVRRYLVSILLAVIVAAVFLSPVFITISRMVFLFPSRIVSVTYHSISDFFLFLLRAKEFEQENRQLKKHITELELENSLLKAELSEFERLKKYKSISSRFIISRIIARDPTNWFKVAFVDAGVNQGIRAGMPVLLPEGVVGRIIEAGPGSSTVLLAIDSSSKISVIISETRELGIVEGTGKGLIMKFFSGDVDAQPGNIVLTSGLGGVFPKGLEVGRIANVNPGGLVATAEITPSVEFNKLEEVLILIK